MQMRKKERRKYLLRITLGLLGVGLAVLVWWGWVPADVSSTPRELTDNGAWISVDWTSNPVDEDAVEQLAAQMSRRDIRYLFPFTTYLKEEGTFNPTYDYAGDFVATFRQFNSEPFLLAWIGLPLENEGMLGINGTVDLADAATRAKIVTLTVSLVEDAGFDGVHLDAETVRSGNQAYLLLLEEVKAVIGDRTLSVAGSYWLPPPINGLPVLEKFKWESDYYREVAARVDQIATMTYDSGMPCPALYRLWMREQVRGIGHSLSESEVELLIGVSVSQEATFTHHPQAENLRSGLAGISAGLSRYTDAGALVDGVAVYAAWEANEVDWRMWERWTSNAP